MCGNSHVQISCKNQADYFVFSILTKIKFYTAGNSTPAALLAAQVTVSPSFTVWRKILVTTPIDSYTEKIEENFNDV